MAWLLIDISNSRTKFRLGDSSGLMDWMAVVPTSDLDQACVREITKKIEFTAVVLASVVPVKEAVLRKSFENEVSYHQLTSQSPLNYGFDVPHPEQVGHDRLANLIALKEKYGAPGIAIDFGTAVTFSVLSGKNTFVGGVIAPGMNCMTEYFPTKTAQLPVIDIKPISSSIGKGTVEAMQIGAALGHRGMVREILTELLKEMDGSPTVVATGGGAEFTASHLREIHKIDTCLTLEGLRILASRIF
jgi:type III pantothenate kinase